MEQKNKERQILGIMWGYSLAALIAGLLLGNIVESFQGLIRILTSPAQLTLDYFKIGTVGGTFLNVGLVGLGCVMVFTLSHTAVNGISLMAFFLTIGFSFFGENFLNMWPCILGTWIFTRVTKKKLSSKTDIALFNVNKNEPHPYVVRFSSQANIALFSTALAPFVSEAIWRYPAFDGMPGAMAMKVLLGILLGVIAGFLMPILCQHSPNLHHGYTLYNAAAVAGFVGILLFSFMYRARGVEIPSNTDIGESFPMVVNGFAIITSLIAILAGFLLNGKSFKGYTKVLAMTGHKCDFTRDGSPALAMINIGVFGLFVTAYYNLTGARMTGPTAGSIICLLAIAPCGAHIFNMLPIMIGYALASTFGAFELNTQAIIVGLCFAGALSPVSGRFGSLSGIVVGLIHACMVTTIVTFHGGMCLYNGGFTCGITAILSVPVLEYFFEPMDKLRLLPKFKTE